MNKNIIRVVSLLLLSFGLFFLISSPAQLTSSVIGIPISSNLSSILAIILIIASIVLFVTGESLEERLEGIPNWKAYKFNIIRQAEDVEKGYLKRKKQESHLTQMQELTEKWVTGGELIKKPHQEHTYEEQFYSGHASKGGRIIDVGSHIVYDKNYSGKLFEKIKRWWNKGKLEHFNQPTNGWYIWIAGEMGNFVIGNREDFESVRHGHKLPHPVLAKGEKVYGAGEVLIQDGLVKEYNCASGHYFDVDNPRGFSKQGKEVFDFFRKKAGWKEVKGGAKYTRVHDAAEDSIHY